MANQTEKPFLNDQPAYPTSVKSRLSGGRFIGIDDSVWVYRQVPLSPVIDASSPAEALNAAQPILAAIEELSDATNVRVKRRGAARSSYRQIHLLSIGLPRHFEVDRTHPNHDYLMKGFGNASVQNRMLFLGVRLVPTVDKSGFSAAIKAVAETLISGASPLSDYDTDYRAVDAMLTRSGLTVPDNDNVYEALSWWSGGFHGDAPLRVDPDHINAFSNADAIRIAKDSGENPNEWPDIDGHEQVSFASVRRLDLGFSDATSSVAWWGAHLMADGVPCVSVRGMVEPSQVTREELRRNRRKYVEDITERAQAGKMERAEQQETMHRLSEVEGMYSGFAPPTIIDTSIIVGFSGHVTDMEAMSNRYGMELGAMLFRQGAALQETWPASVVRANPILHDFPATTIACSGLGSLSTVGDRTGALVGFTERDRQPAWLSPSAASKNDGLPIAIGVGATGSGKATSWSTKVPTPSGWTTVGELSLGDLVYSRDGKSCVVTHMTDHPEPVMFDVRLSDGQVIRAHDEHQWVVSSFVQRHRGTSPKRQNAIARWDSIQQLAEIIESLAGESAPGSLCTADEILEILRSNVDLGDEFPSAGSVVASLRMVGCPEEVEVRTVPVNNPDEVVKFDPCVVYPIADLLEANIASWSETLEKGGTNVIRWGSKIESKISAANRMAESGDAAGEATAAEICRRLRAHGADLPQSSKQRLADVALAAGVERSEALVEVTIPMPPTSEMNCGRPVWPVDIALKSLAARLRQSVADARPNVDYDERVMTTGEMIAAGIKVSSKASNFAIRASAPIVGVESDLSIDPYVLGAWLGDGSSYGGQITSSPKVVDPETGVSDQQFMMGQISEHFGAAVIPSSDQTVSVYGLVTLLRQQGLIRNKHIPTSYLRGSIDQRLALLQGVMDTDGTIDENGSCELTLCDERLINDCLELIRSLGIKASMSSSDACLTEEDPDRIGSKRRRVVGTRWRVLFTTTQQVFRLPRKARRIPAEVRDTQNWLYITDIVPAETEPARCIQVDSEDHTYLVEGFVPTHNTMLMLHLADQYARAGHSTIIVDPKMGSDHSQVVLNAGGQVASLDDLVSADGIFDPLRFAKTPEQGVELASSLLLTVNPWGSSMADMETPVIRSLAYGVENGATCIGEALELARKDGYASDELVDPVLGLADASKMFRACVGVDPSTESLSVSEGITLIKVGSAHLDLPDPGVPIRDLPQQQRVTTALVRAMVFGSAMALSGRDGVVMLDEAWVFLGAGRSEVERLGRLARSQRVLPFLFTQRVTDATDAGLAGYISRGLILPIADPEEAEAALDLFGLEATEERMRRITAKATVGAGSSVAGAAPNWDSMRALRDPRTGDVLRGSVAIYSDLAGRAVPVEVKLPTEFLELASTNPDDVDRRRTS